MFLYPASKRKIQNHLLSVSDDLSENSRAVDPAGYFEGMNNDYLF
jgi:hypothetical protein